MLYFPYSTGGNDLTLAYIAICVLWCVCAGVCMHVCAHIYKCMREHVYVAIAEVHEYICIYVAIY